MRRFLIAALAMLPLAAYAQQQPAPPAPVCISPALAQALHVFLQQGKSTDDLLIEAVALNLGNALTTDARNKQKADDDAVTAKAVTDAIQRTRAEDAAKPAPAAAPPVAKP